MKNLLYTLAALVTCIQNLINYIHCSFLKKRSTVIQIAPKEEQCSKHGAKYFEGHEYGLNEGAVGGLLDGKEVS